jgi:hypothetical protein
VLTSAEEKAALARDATKKLEIHQTLVDVLLDSVTVMEMIARTGLGDAQFDALREKYRTMESRMEAVVSDADKTYGEEEAWGAEGNALVTRVSRVDGRVSQTKVVVDAAVAKRMRIGRYDEATRRFASGLERHRVVGRVQLTERAARGKRFVRRVDEDETEVIDLESGSDEDVCFEEDVDVESESDEGEEDFDVDVESQEGGDSNDDIPE